MEELALVSRARASSDGRGLALQLWDMRSAAVVQSYKGAVVCRGGLCATRDVLLAASEERGNISAWRWKTDNPAMKMPIVERVTALAATKDGRLCLAGGQSGALYGWELATGRMVICVRSAHYRKINAIAVADDDAVCFTCGDDALVRVWSLLSLCGGEYSDQALAATASAKPLLSLHRHTLPVTALCCSLGPSDGARLYTGGKDRQCLVWELVTGNLLAALSLPSDVTALAIDPAEVHLYIGTGSGSILKVLLHDTSLEKSATGWASRPQQRISAHGSAVQDVKVTLDGKHLLTVALDGQLRIWDTHTLQVVKLWTDEPLNNVVLVPRAYINAESHPTPIVQFARQPHDSGSVVRDAATRDLSYSVASLREAAAESAADRGEATGRRLVHELLLGATTGSHSTEEQTRERQDKAEETRDSEAEEVEADATATSNAKRTASQPPHRTAKLARELQAWRSAAGQLLNLDSKALAAGLQEEAAAVAQPHSAPRRSSGQKHKASKKRKENAGQ